MHQRIRVGLHRVIGVIFDAVQLLAHEDGKGAPGLVPDAHLKRHAAHVRMHQNRVGRLVGRLGACRCPALQTLGGEIHRALIGHLAQPQPLQTDGKTLVVHHGEHRRQPLMRLADQHAFGTVEVHHAGRAALDAHLVLDGATADRIRCRRLAIGIKQVLGDQKQRDAARARRRIRQLGEHQMHDVVDHVVLAAGDPDLGAGETIARQPQQRVIALEGVGTGADQAEIRAAMRLGQTHGAQPVAGIHARQKHLLDGLRRMAIHRQTGAGIQCRIERETGIGGVEHLFKGHGEHLGHALTTVFRIAAQPHPAAFGEHPIGLLEALGRRDVAILETRTLGVTAQVERQQLGLGHARTFLENRLGQLDIHLFGGCHARPFLLGGEHLIENEACILEWCLILGHITVLTDSCA